MAWRRSRVRIPHGPPGKTSEGGRDPKSDWLPVREWLRQRTGAPPLARVAKSGRRAELKPRCPQGRPGSSPGAGTGRQAGPNTGIDAHASMAQLVARFPPTEEVAGSIPAARSGSGVTPRTAARTWSRAGGATVTRPLAGGSDTPGERDSLAVWETAGTAARPCTEVRVRLPPVLHCGCGPAVGRLLAKEKIVGSNPTIRSMPSWRSR